MKMLVSLVLATAALAALPAESEAQCMKWRAALSPCQYFQNAPGCSDVATMMWAQRRAYFLALYSDDAQRACESSYINYPYNGPIEAVVDPDAPDQAECWIDYNSDNIVEVPTQQDPISPDGYTTVVHFEPVPREPQCDLVPNGPYGPFVVGPANPTEGGKFSKSVREQIRDLNYAPRIQKYISDAPMDRIDHPTPNRQTMPPYEDDYFENDGFQLQPTWAESMQIDHIIPRKDIHGCPCGTNDPANAAVVSAGHNNAMSNQMDHPGRIELLTLYTNYVAASAAPGWRPPESDELARGDDEVVGDEGAGCTAGGGGSSWLLVGAALVALGRRARRVRGPTRASA